MCGPVTFHVTFQVRGTVCGKLVSQVLVATCGLSEPHFGTSAEGRPLMTHSRKQVVGCQAQQGKEFEHGPGAAIKLRIISLMQTPNSLTSFASSYFLG